jgi:dihydroorotate dehydrogenase electron transfer subunit
MGMFLVKAKIIYNKRVKANFFRCKIIAPEIARSAKPGQFVDIRINEGCQPLLRRPFGVHRADAKTFEILYEVVGMGTQALSQKKAQEDLDILGPLGNGFDHASPVTRNTPRVLVAGGMGVAPLVFLAEILAYSVERIAYSKKLSAKRYSANATVLIGAKTKSHITCEEEFKKLGCDVKIATDDGSRGFKGRVTELLIDMLRRTKDEGRRTIYACGPRPMLKEVCRISEELDLPAQISLEEHMGCGVGACLGCVVNTKQGFKRVCKDGPVFSAQDLIWE